MNNWVTALFHIGRRQRTLNMFGGRRNNRGMMWMSILSLGVSAAAYGLRRNRNSNMLRSVQNVMNNFSLRKANQMPNMATLNEFSNELVPNKKPLTNR